MVNFYLYGMLFVGLWKSAASSKKCVKIEVVEDFAKNRIVVVQQNDTVSLTFGVNTDACQNNKQKLALSSHERDSILDVCRIIFTNGTCQESEVKQPCSCVNSTKHRVHIHLSITGVDYKSYHWTATSQTSFREELMEIIFVIRTPAILTNCAQILSTETDKKEEEFQSRRGSSFDGLLLIIVLGTCLVVGATITGTCIVKLHRKTRGSRGGNAQNETTNGNEGERTSKKSDSSTSSPGQAAGNGSKSGGSTPRSSSSGSDKPSTNPNYTSTALQEVEIHPYMDLHTRDPTYASTTSSKDPHMYMELKTLKAESKSPQQGSGRNGNDGYETPRVPGQGNQSSDGYETPQPPREERRRSALYANQGRSDEPIQEEVNYYNEA